MEMKEKYQGRENNDERGVRGGQGWKCAVERRKGEKERE